MPVFISYSHQDKEFVDKLAANLSQAKTHVWVDRWEIKVGESIISKIQDAIQDSSALITILSKAISGIPFFQERIECWLDKRT